MTESPQRPPRPDELERFHNGDTLDNIPVVRLPPPAAPAPRRTWWALGAAALAAAIVGALVGVAAVQLAGDGDSQEGSATSALPSTNASTSAASKPDPASSTEPSAAAQPTPTESPTIATQAGLEEVRIIQTPVTGGDPSTSYCLVYTGSDSGGVKEAILLANAPAYQCTDLLPYDPEGMGSFLTQVPSCERPSRAAVLSFAEVTDWGDSAYFTCLTRHTGA